MPSSGAPVALRLATAGSSPGRSRGDGGSRHPLCKDQPRSEGSYSARHHRAVSRRIEEGEPVCIMVAEWCDSCRLLDLKPLTRSKRRPVIARFANHLLWRLRHRAEADAIDHALERGILVEGRRTAEERKVRTFTTGPTVAGKSDAEILRLVQQRASGGSDQALLRKNRCRPAAVPSGSSSARAATGSPPAG